THGPAAGPRQRLAPASRTDSDFLLGLFSGMLQAGSFQRRACEGRRMQTQAESRAVPVAVAEGSLAAREFVSGGLIAISVALAWVVGFGVVAGRLTLPQGRQGLGLGLGLIGMAAGFFALRGLLAWWQFRRLPPHCKRYTWWFFEDHIEARSAAASSEFQYQLFARVKETSSLFLFFVQGPLCNVVPKRALRDESQIAAVRRLVKAALGPRAKLR